jgi:hypothetical protein
MDLIQRICEKSLRTSGSAKNSVRFLHLSGDVGNQASANHTRLLIESEAMQIWDLEIENGS